MSADPSSKPHPLIAFTHNVRRMITGSKPHPLIAFTHNVRRMITGRLLVEEGNYRRHPDERVFPTIKFLSFHIWRSDILPFLTQSQTKYTEPDDKCLHASIAALGMVCRATRYLVEREPCWVSLRLRFVLAMDKRHSETTTIAERNRRRDLFRCFCMALDGPNSNFTSKNSAQLLDDCTKTLPMIWPLAWLGGPVGAVYSPGFLALQKLEPALRDNIKVRLEILRDIGAIDVEREALFRYLALRPFHPFIQELATIFLEQWHCDVNAGGMSDGATALHVCVYARNLEFARWLLTANARVDLPAFRSLEEKVLEGETVVQTLRRHSLRSPVAYAPLVELFATHHRELFGAW